jgi:hypothetical protein
MKLATLLRSNEYIVVFSGTHVMVIIGNRTEQVTLPELQAAERLALGAIITRAG